jgi:predicted anti-sigma-YlaC factor YlaD
MSCPRFEKEGYLFLSGELNPGEQKAFETHLAECDACRQTMEEVKNSWWQIEKLSKVRPGKSVRKAVLQAARRPREKVSFIERLFPNPRLVWGLSAAAAAIILIFIIASPLNRNGLKSISGHSEFSWDDDFFAQADFIEREIDRVQSGALLTNYFSSAEDPSESDLLNSVLSPDIDRIKDKVVDLARTIYGI